MKEEPVDSSYYRVLCEIWQRENQCKREDFNPRVVLFRADEETFWRQVGSSLPLIKEEPEEVAIKEEEEEEEEEEEIFARSSACVKNEEEICTQSTVCVKHEEDVPLLLLHNTPDRDGFIRMLTFHSVDLQRVRPLDCKDLTKNTSTSLALDRSVGLRERSDSEEDQGSNRPPAWQKFQIAIQKTGGRKLKSRNPGRKNASELKEGGPVSSRCPRSKRKSSNGAKEKKRSTQASLRCQDCGASFNHLSNLRRHKRVHNGKRPFSCRLCDRRFAQNYNLNSHMSTCHPDQFSHHCSQCKKGFRSTEALESHTLRNPVKCQRKCGKRVRCGECGKSFSLKESLRVHMSVHTGRYPLTCTVCGKGFNRAFDFDVHMRVHTGERPFSCSECGSCFKSLSHYNDHMRIHSGEKPFTCPLCNRGFYRNTHLKSHMKVHRVKKRFTCKLCFKEYESEYGFKRHMKIHYIQEKYGVTSYGRACLAKTQSHS